MGNISVCRTEDYGAMFIHKGKLKLSLMINSGKKENCFGIYSRSSSPILCCNRPVLFSKRLYLINGKITILRYFFKGLLTPCY